MKVFFLESFLLYAITIQVVDGLGNMFAQANVIPPVHPLSLLAKIQPIWRGSEAYVITYQDFPNDINLPQYILFHEHCPQLCHEHLFRVPPTQ